MKGMVLAAGLGTRMIPLSDHLPKPMFPAANMPLVDYALHRLHTQEIREVAVNLHHLPEVLREHLAAGSRFGQSVTFSEEPVILGTGGAVKALREWFGRETFCVTNGDTLLLADLAQVVQTHRRTGALATLALLRHGRPGRFSLVEVDEGDRVTDIAGLLNQGEGAEGGVFVGFHVLEPEIFDHMPDRDHFCIVQDLYLPLIQNHPGSVAASFVDGTFFDMGTPADYLMGNISLLADHLNESSMLVQGMRHLGENVFVGSDVRLGRGVNLIGPCLIGKGARIEGGSEIGPGTCVGQEAYLGAWTRLSTCVVWPGALLPGGGQYRQSIVYERQALIVEPPKFPDDEP